MQLVLRAAVGVAGACGVFLQAQQLAVVAVCGVLLGVLLLQLQQYLLHQQEQMAVVDLMALMLMMQHC
jgi:hypothetical protein